VPGTETNSYLFNMHRLFPERVPADDPTGMKAWDHDRFVETTGSKWTPDVYIQSSPDGLETFLNYDSAWTPNNGTLQRLHELTGWEIENRYKEEGCLIAGIFHCVGGSCNDIEREYMTSCEICEVEKPDDEYDEEAEDLICNECRRKAKPLLP